MQRIAVQLFTFSTLDYPAEVHHSNDITEKFNNRQVMRDEKKCQTKLILQILEQVQYL